MFQYKVQLLSLSDSIGFEIKSPSKEQATEFLDDLFFTFSQENEQGQLTVPVLQKNSKELQTKISAFNNKYKSKLHALNGIPAYFRKLREDESFFFLPGSEFEHIDHSEFYFALEQEQGDKSSREKSARTKKLFDSFLSMYQVTSYGEKRASIGHKIKSERVCRFCNEKQPKVSFKNRAHAISEGLGNSAFASVGHTKPMPYR